jgi:hypothetical protein
MMKFLLRKQLADYSNRASEGKLKPLAPESPLTPSEGERVAVRPGEENSFPPIMLQAFLVLAATSSFAASVPLSSLDLKPMTCGWSEPVNGG